VLPRCKLNRRKTSTCTKSGGLCS